MRSDMHHVLCDEPRHGARLKDRKGRKRAESKVPDDEKPVKEKGNLRQRWTSNWGDHKNFGEHLGPLRHFVLSCIGRPWNDVHSEICQYISRNNVVQKHILTHLYQYVATDVYMKDGFPYDKNYGNYRSRNGLPVYQDTFVHPESGLLCRTPVRKRKKRVQKEVIYVKINDKEAYYKSNGIWYKCKFKPLPIDEEIAGGYDILLRKRWGWAPYTLTNMWWYKRSNRDNVIGDFTKVYGAPQYCVEKRQIGSTELKRLKNKLSSD